jgi:hypothetical protein
MEWTEKEIKILKDEYEKIGPSKISIKLNRTKSSVHRKAMRLGLSCKKDSFYETDEFKDIVSKSRNILDVCNNLGLKVTGGNRNTIKKWIKIRNIETSHFFHKRVSRSSKYSLDEILIDDSLYTNIPHLKKRLFRQSIKERKCELCGQGEEWMGKKMALILDHKNGKNNDNRIENLRIVCPNCNGTLDTHGGKNIKNKLKQVIKN